MKKFQFICVAVALGCCTILALTTLFLLVDCCIFPCVNTDVDISALVPWCTLFWVFARLLAPITRRYWDEMKEEDNYRVPVNSLQVKGSDFDIDNKE